jgi:L-iditol 2-dehydrogenase
MRASVLVDAGRLEVRDVERPEVSPHGLLLRVASVGLCGTDHHIFSGEANYTTDERGVPIPLSVRPQILGHEFAGVVEEIGAEVRDLAPGDRVVVDQGINCRSARREPACEYCATGHSHQCERYLEHGIASLPGALADYIAVPAVNAIRVDADLASTEAALVEPLACVLHAVESLERAASARYRLADGDPARRVRTALVFGAGPAGLLFVQHLREVTGFDGKLLVAEPNARKRALAEQMGAETIDPTTTDIVGEIAARTDGRRVELVVEASGAGAVFPVLPGVMRKQGSLLLYGHGHGGVDMSALNAVQFMEPALVTPTGASGGFDADGRPSIYRRALGLIASRRVAVAPIVSHRYDALEQVSRAFTEDYHAPDFVKGVVTLDSERWRPTT